VLQYAAMIGMNRENNGGMSEVLDVLLKAMRAQIGQIMA